jgi:hypothetical protein
MSTKADEQALPDAPKRPMRVAIVEDDPTLRQFIEQLVAKESHGFLPHGA